MIYEIHMSDGSTGEAEGLLGALMAAWYMWHDAYADGRNERVVAATSMGTDLSGWFIPAAEVLIGEMKEALDAGRRAQAARGNGH